METLLEMKNISKSFPGVKALDNVSFDVRAGEVIALAGANGAGKSTLLKILTGVYTRDEGEVKVLGETVHFKNPEEGKRAGIAAIYQELTVIPNLTVCENIFISEMKDKFHINHRKYNAKAEELLRELDVSFHAKDKVADLTVANRQMVEIARAVNENSRILIMDEPTSALTNEEKDKLFSVAKSMREKGLGIVFVTHRMNDIFELCYRATVMKDGKLVGTYDIQDLDEGKIVELMLSRSLKSYFPEKHDAIGDVVLSVKNLRRGSKVKDVSFDLRKGEILGITGLLGSGRTETARCLFGVDKPESGDILLHGHKLKMHSPRDAVRNGIGLVSEDRKELGLVLNMAIGDNICFGSKEVKTIRNKAAERKTAEEYIAMLDVKCTGPKQAVGNLSGGNQQKVVIAKWLLRNCEVLILDEPTRGIDVSAKAEIYKLINRIAADGAAVIMISGEQDEIIGMCDRAVVLYEGTCVGELERSEFSEEKILQMSHNYAS